MELSENSKFSVKECFCSFMQSRNWAFSDCKRSSFLFIWTRSMGTGASSVASLSFSRLRNCNLFNIACDERSWIAIFFISAAFGPVEIMWVKATVHIKGFLLEAKKLLWECFLEKNVVIEAQTVGKLGKLNWQI